MVEREPDLDGFGKINKDPSAYILRRNGCAQYVNRCGMPPNLVDVLMGHEIVKSDPTDWIARVRRPDTWPEIAAAEEHWVLDPEYSAHPCFRAVGLQASTDTELPLYSEASFEVEEDGAYVFAFDAPEANDAVAISLSCAGAAVDLPVISLSNEEHPPIIGSVPSPTFFEIAHRKAAKLDIHTIIPEESDDHEEE